MPLTTELEGLLALITDTTQREAMRKTLTEMHEGQLRQSDYDRVMNESKKETERLQAEAKASIQRNQEWWNKNNDTHEETLKILEQTERERDDLRGKIEAAAKNATGNGTGNNGTGIDEARLKTYLENEFSGRKFVSAVEAESAAKKYVDGVLENERKRFFSETLPATTNFNMSMVDIQFRHRDEFGKPLDRVALAKFITDNKLDVSTADNLNKAYDGFVSQARMDKKIEEIKVQAEKDAKTKFSVPGTGAAPAPELGHLQQRLQSKDGLPEIIFNDAVKPGSGQLAAAAAAELRSEGKG